jgi:phage baseplate assembly protein W
MASVVIDTLKIVDNKNKFIYKDLNLDLKLDYILEPTVNSKKTIRDITASEDVEAVKNSIFNLFTTMPGQKILNPIYGLNLLQFVFNGITETGARMMGDLIFKGITKFEPRVTVKKVFILPDIENQNYEIALRLDVPSLNIQGITIKGKLSDSGFYLN